MSVQALRRGFLVSARALLLTTAALKLATLLKTWHHRKHQH